MLVCERERVGGVELRVSVVACVTLTNTTLSHPARAYVLVRVVFSRVCADVSRRGADVSLSHPARVGSYWELNVLAIRLG